jgi:hypothetical protein
MNSLSSDWQTFLSAELGALATLTGLVVVAISINLSRILAVANLPSRAGESLIMLVGALVVVSVALVPQQPPILLGAEFLSIGLVTFVAPATNQIRLWNLLEGVTSGKQYVRLAITSIASVPFVVAGGSLIFGGGGAFYWVALGVIVSLVAGVWNSWILLIEILR